MARLPPCVPERVYRGGATSLRGLPGNVVRGLQPACSALIPLNDSKTCFPGPKGGGSQMPGTPIRHGENTVTFSVLIATPPLDRTDVHLNCRHRLIPVCQEYESPDSSPILFAPCQWQ